MNDDAESAAMPANAMVTSPHWLASAAGRAVLTGGGTAIEAAIAMGAALAVVYPHFCGLGGDAVWMVADAEGNAEALLGIGQAARSCGAPDGPIPARGPRSALTSACVVDSWGMAIEYARTHWGARNSFARLLEPAIALAEEGFAISSSQAFWLDYRREEFASWPGFAALFDTSALVPGQDIFRQPDLARSLAEIARDGSRAFYEGDLAGRIARGLDAAGSPLDVSDLMATRTRIEAPLRLKYHGLDLLAPPPPTQGVTTLEIMGILDRLGIETVAEGSADFYHLCIEAIKQAFLSRGEIADPDVAKQDVARWLSPLTLDGKAAHVDPGQAMAWPHVFKTGDTVFFAAVDAKGRAASVLQSIYFDWGSGVVVGDTGIVWQNRGAAFSHDPHSPNYLRPGARPFYTLNPGMALKKGRPHLLYGTQGADGQPQTLATLLVRIINHRLSPQQALAAPRFLLGRTFSDSRDSVKIEEDAGDGVLDALAARGHEISLLSPKNPIAGQAGIIRVDNGMVEGAHDPRSDGIALEVIVNASPAEFGD
ncbi:gamma-glutamyltransferase family protein [Aliihoeflea sp. PC F10.4]